MYSIPVLYLSDSVHEKTGKVAKECDMNTAGEVNGTIVRGEQVLDFKKAKVSSAVQAFKTRKRYHSYLQKVRC